MGILNGSELYAKIYKKNSTRNAITSKLKMIFKSNFETTFLNSLTKFWANFEFGSFEVTEKQSVKKRDGRAGPSWVGLGWGGAWPIHRVCRLCGKKNFIFSSAVSKKSVVTEITRCLKVPYDCKEALNYELAIMHSFIF